MTILVLKNKIYIDKIKPYIIELNEVKGSHIDSVRSRLLFIEAEATKEKDSGKRKMVRNTLLPFIPISSKTARTSPRGIVTPMNMTLSFKVLTSAARKTMSLLNRR